VKPKKPSRDLVAAIVREVDRACGEISRSLRTLDAIDEARRIALLRKLVAVKRRTEKRATRRRTA
jgi:hypothetical protein